MEESPENRHGPQQISIMGTIQAILEAYEQQAAECVEMEERILQYKSYKEYTQKIQRKSGYTLQDMVQQYQALHAKCRYLENEVEGYESKLAAMEASQTRQRS